MCGIPIRSGLLLFAAAACLALVLSPATWGEEPKTDEKLKEPEKLDCTTFDGVKLAGYFYPSDKGKDAPTVILCHAVGDAKRSGASRKDFGDLPRMLQKEGFAVVAFDFRGYGESKTLARPKDYFAANPPPRPFPGGKLPTTIDAAKDFRDPLDFAKFGNDLIAIKDYIVTRSNARDCNSNNIVVVGAEQGAMVGLMWAFNEFARPKEIGGRESEGQDITAFVWISMRPWIGSSRIDKQTEAYLKALHKEVPTLVVYGEKDQTTANFWNNAIGWIKPKNEKGFEATKAVALKSDLQGTKLFGQESLNTEKVVVDYLKANLPNRVWKERRGQTPPPTLFAIERLGLK
jgi:alpha-beta hydrolase superfamily lysophospholipase